MTGRITDASAAVIPGVSVTVRNVATGIDRKISSNNDGYYTAPLLLPGEYRVTVEHQGFRPVVRSGVVLEVDQRAEINFVLEVGALAERIEVRAAALQLNTQEASQGQVIENQRIVKLPLNGRNYDELTLLSGAIRTPPPGHSIRTSIPPSSHPRRRFSSGTPAAISCGSEASSTGTFRRTRVSGWPSA